MSASQSIAHALCYEKISVINHGAYVMRYRLRKENGLVSQFTDNYPVGQHITVNLSEQKFRPEGCEDENAPFETLKNREKIEVYLDICAGVHEWSDEIMYSPNGQTATFSATGITISASIKLI